jgi:hypothetical protein
MRRALVLLLAAVVGLVTLATPASAEGVPGRGGGHRPPVTVTGTVAADGTWDADLACGFVRDQLTGTYDAAERRWPDGTITLDLCLTDFTAEGFPIVGTFTVATDNGVSLAGTLTGFMSIPAVRPPEGLPIDLGLVVTGSSGTRRPVTGTISIAAGYSSPVYLTSAMGGTFTAEFQL